MMVHLFLTSERCPGLRNNGLTLGGKVAIVLGAHMMPPSSRHGFGFVFFDQQEIVNEGAKKDIIIDDVDDDRTSANAKQPQF